MNLSEGLQTLNELRAINKETTEIINQRFDFVKGLSFGLVYGVVGNLFVQYLYGFIERMFLGIFDSLFYFDVLILTFSVFAIIITSLKLRKQIKKFKTYRKYVEMHEKEIEKLEEMIKEVQKLVNAKPP